MPKQKQIENQDYMQINPEQVKQTIEIPVKRIDESEIIKIEKPASKPASKPERKKSKIQKIKKSEIIEREDKISKIKNKLTELIITEKPAAAEKIAVALGNAEKKIMQGAPYYEINKNGKKNINWMCSRTFIYSDADRKKIRMACF